MSILDEIAKRARARVAERKKALPLDEIVEKAAAMRASGGGVGASASFPFERALRGEGNRGSGYSVDTGVGNGSAGGIAFICEVKKASPSKGVIAENFPYIDIAMEYEAAGAAAISVLTEPHYFLGDERHLREIANRVSIPLLRKDFIVDSYMIYEAKLLGAAAVLLICALLDQRALADYIDIAHCIGMSALVEAHDEAELDMALGAGARVVGVNNRDLKTFEVDMGISLRLRALAPDDVIFVAESGVRTAEDINILQRHGVDAVLIGETLMRAPDKKAALAALRGLSILEWET